MLKMLVKSRLILQSKQCLRSLSLATNQVQERSGRDLVFKNCLVTDNRRLVEFYRKTYLQDDQVVVASGVTDLNEIENFIEIRLVNKHSMLLEDCDDGRIVSAVSGGPINVSTDRDIRVFADLMMSDPASRRLLHLWATITSDSKLLDRFQLPEAWDVSFVATEPRMRNMGLARFLLGQQQRLASTRGYKVLSVHCTSNAMAKVCERAKYQILLKRRLKNYRDEFGSPFISKDHLVRIYYTHLRPRKRLFFHTEQ